MKTAKPSWKLWLAAGLIGALLALLAVGMSLNPRELPSVLIGKPWPALRLATLEGGAPQGAADWAGRPRVLNLWASWCASCREEHPALLALARQLQAQGRGDQLIGLNYKDRGSDAQAWLRRLGNPYAANLVDADGRLAIELGVYGAPETFVVDARGTIVWKHVGPLNEALIAAEILPRLELKP